MARTKAVLGGGARLSDYLSASLLARVYPAEVVRELLDKHEVNSQRVRNFPAETVTYYCTTGSGLNAVRLASDSVHADSDEAPPNCMTCA